MKSWVKNAKQKLTNFFSVAKTLKTLKKKTRVDPGHEARPFGRIRTAPPPRPGPVRLVTKAAWPRQASSRVHCNRPGAAPRASIATKIGALDAPETCAHFAARLASVRAL